jgi:hypothetical protein
MSECTSRQRYARPVLKVHPNEQRDLGKHAVPEPLACHQQARISPGASAGTTAPQSCSL